MRSSHATHSLVFAHIGSAIHVTHFFATSTDATPALPIAGGTRFNR